MAYTGVIEADRYAFAYHGDKGSGNGIVLEPQKHNLSDSDCVKATQEIYPILDGYCWLEQCTFDWVRNAPNKEQAKIIGQQDDSHLQWVIDTHVKCSSVSYIEFIKSLAEVTA